MPKNNGHHEDREKPMETPELKEAYLKVFIKYALEGVHMMHPETVPLFTGESHNVHDRAYGKAKAVTTIKD